MCSSLESIVVPSSVETICESCFAECQRLRHFVFAPNSQISHLGEWAFLSCRVLESICIPASIQTISNSCFSSCSSLATLTFESGCKGSIVRQFAYAEHASPGSIWVPSSIDTICACRLSRVKVFSVPGYDDTPQPSILEDSSFWIVRE
jgi:hypothetical protein